jgi:hypothetical protein
MQGIQTITLHIQSLDMPLVHKLTTTRQATLPLVVNPNETKLLFMVIGCSAVAVYVHKYNN